MAITVNLNRFKQFVRDVAQERKKPEAEVLNKGLTTAIIGSSKYKGIVQLAPKATREQINTDLRHNDLNVKLATKQLREQGYFATKRTRAEIQQKIAEICRARLKKRQRSRAYIAAGWIRALRDLGILGSKNKGKREVNYWPGGTAAQGYGIPANANRLIAKAFSMSRGSEEVLSSVMEIAVENACLDMADYFLNKMGRLLKGLASQ